MCMINPVNSSGFSGAGQKKYTIRRFKRDKERDERVSDADTTLNMMPEVAPEEQTLIDFQA